ncbi:DUF4235 domain-containing protein [Propionimicrobium sp. PCR01-08-3]|uniref:DUF4235 domain-containing protein n=1 Tax=Propionimicrobium sp. PCR01-08-3 TaxID=3052086 RepID=UPI00255C7C8B|nr:DUF4235 domain-containing protein [Propionimicrobium sp. PCR01-08-3]WIY82928.1 DUF4235 domain-containing protein [Propionimicrobium sp. PCR01-08-3]
MAKKQTGSKPAKILYRPLGLIGSVVSGAVAGVIFKKLWKRASPSSSQDTPDPLESEFGLREVLIAAALQGAIYATVQALVNRGGARLFQRLTGEWPGN